MTTATRAASGPPHSDPPAATGAPVPDPVPFRPVDLLPVDLAVERRDDGSIVLRSRHPLRAIGETMPAILARQGALGDKPYIAQRQGPDRAWRFQTYAETKARADAIAQWLLDRRIEPGRPVLILSGNSIAHATLRFGAFAAGVPVCPVSVNYGLMGGDYGRLRHVVELVRPAVVFIENAKPFLGALTTVDWGDAAIVTAAPVEGMPPHTRWEDVLATPVTQAVAASIARVTLDTPAAYMLTSGSTGRPKAVVQTHRMINTNLAQAIQTLGAAAGWDEVMMDWLPWSHVSGAFAPYSVMVLGGLLYIDEGKPLPGLFEESLRNLREVPIRYYVNVPAGYAMLVDALEADEALRRTFFKELRLMLYGGAGLPQPVLDRLQAMAVRTVGHRILMTTGYGATETTSGCLSIHWETDQVGIGLPMPGTVVKLVPYDHRYEVRIAGPNIFAGYLNQPEKNAGLFDAEGFYGVGDLALFQDPGDPSKGLAFAGRMAEEFKLGTGSWVSGGDLRAALVRALSPLVADLVVCGDGRDHVCILAWPNLVALRRELGLPADAPPAAVLDDPRVAAWIAERLARHNAANPGLSTAVRRCRVLTRPPDPNAHELSDKGSVNRAAILANRAADVDALYADPPGPGVIVID